MSLLSSIENDFAGPEGYVVPKVSKDWLGILPFWLAPGAELDHRSREQIGGDFDGDGEVLLLRAGPLAILGIKCDQPGVLTFIGSEHV